MSERTVLKLTFFLYILVLLGLGVYFFLTTRSRKLTEYLLADREVGYILTGASEAASVASGWTFFAWVGIGFGTGFNGLYFALFFLIMVGFLYGVMGRPFRRQSEELESLTVTDHLSVAFDRLPAACIRVAGTLAVVMFFGSYVGSQLKAVGGAVEEGIQLTFRQGVIGGGAVIVMYTVLGGFRASVWTDLIQAVLIMFAAVALPIVAIAEIGGIREFLTEVRNVDPTLLTLSAGASGWDYLVSVLVWLTFAFAVIGQPHSLMRFQSITDDEDLFKAGMIAMIFQAIRMTLPLVIGVAGRVLYAQVSIDNSEQVGMMMLTDLFHPVIAGLLLAGIISAIISTSDSMIIVVASDITRGCRELFPEVMNDRVQVYVGRVVIVLFAVIGVLLALFQPGTIFDIIQFAFVGLGATFGVPLLYLLFWEHTTGWGVFAGLLAGVAVSLLHKYWVLPDYFPILVWPVVVPVVPLVSWCSRNG